jgi:hypothetical protein
LQVDPEGQQKSPHPVWPVGQAHRLPSQGAPDGQHVSPHSCSDDPGQQSPSGCALDVVHDGAVDGQTAFPHFVPVESRPAQAQLVPWQSWQENPGGAHWPWRQIAWPGGQVATARGAL